MVSAQADVVEPAVVAQRDDPGVVDFVVSDAVVGGHDDAWRCRCRLRPARERGRRGVAA
jgi:hypothetical protein